MTVLSYLINLAAMILITVGVIVLAHVLFRMFIWQR